MLNTFGAQSNHYSFFFLSIFSKDILSILYVLFKVEPSFWSYVTSIDFIGSHWRLLTSSDLV